MRVSGFGVAPLALFTLLMAGCAAMYDPGAPGSPEPTTGSSGPAPDALVGSYSVEYRTTESDSQAITDETIVRAGEVTGSCSDDQCDLTFTTELKAADGSTVTVSTALTYDGAAYHGTQTSEFSCDGMTTLTTIEDGIEYTSDTTITPTATVVEGSQERVISFEIVTVERNEVTSAGRDAGCLKINLSGPEPYVTNATTVGEATREVSQ